MMQSNGLKGQKRSAQGSALGTLKAQNFTKLIIFFSLLDERDD